MKPKETVAPYRIGEPQIVNTYPAYTVILAQFSDGYFREVPTENTVEWYRGIYVYDKGLYTRDYIDRKSFPSIQDKKGPEILVTITTDTATVASTSVLAITQVGQPFSIVIKPEVHKYIAYFSDGYYRGVDETGIVDQIHAKEIYCLSCKEFHDARTDNNGVVTYVDPNRGAC